MATIKYRPDASSPWQKVWVRLTQYANEILTSKGTTVDDEIKSLSSQVSNPNLLDNWWFGNGVINQRGATSWSSGYGVDRWEVVNGTATVTDNGLAVNGTVRQKLEKAPNGETTVSVKMYSGTATAIYDAVNNCVDITSAGGVIRAVKLEYGTVSTLANDSAPNYAVELLKCQRYFISNVGANASGYTDPSGTFRVGFLAPTEMRRSNPSVIIKNLDNVVIHYGIIAVSSITAASAFGNKIVLYGTLNGTFSTHLNVTTANTDVDLSADL